jgi:hypothetical protein
MTTIAKAGEAKQAQTPAAESSDVEMARLQAAAQAKDEQAFLAARHAIDWSARPPDDFIRAVRLALMAGAYLAARNLATEGAAQHPAHAEMQKVARVLAPPKAARSTMPPNPGLRANSDWLRAHADEYRGQWVAVRDGHLLGSAPSLKELKRAVGDTHGVLLTTVY